MVNPVSDSLTLLDELQRRAAIYKAAGKSNTVIATMLGVTPQTLCNWGKQPAFKQLVWDLLEEEQHAWRCEAISKAKIAIATLVEVMENAGYRDKTSAAKELLTIVSGLEERIRPAVETVTEEIPSGVSDQVATDIRQKILGLLG